MTILPLVERELRLRSRDPACYWTRFAAALGGMLVCTPALTMSAFSSAAKNGGFAFNGLVTTAFILCCFSGFMTVDGISRERREGTLGLLFLTRVKVLDVLLGNFGAAGLAGLCALAACVPVLIVPILTGGVSGGEAARKVLALFDTMILSLAAGLWGSARGRGWWPCARSAALTLLAVVLGPLLLTAWFPPFSRLHVTWPGPLRALEAANDISYRKAPGAYWISIVVIHVISWLLVLGAGLRLRRALREDEESPTRGARFASDHKARPGFRLAHIKIQSRGHKPPAEGEAPLAWLLRRQRGVKKVVWAGALLGMPYFSMMLSLGILSPSRAYLSMGIWWGINLALTVVGACLFAWAASRFFVESRRGGELELLMTTPEGAGNLVAGQWQWLKHVFWWPTVALMAPSAMKISWLIFDALLQKDGHTLYAVLTHLISCVSIIARMAALLWVGMWCGWRERSQARAIVRAVILCQGVTYLFGLLGSLVVQSRGLAILNVNPRFGVSLTEVWHVLVLLIPQIAILLYYIYLCRWARRRLEVQLGQTLPKSGLDWLLNSIYQPG